MSKPITTLYAAILRRSGKIDRPHGWAYLLDGYALTAGPPR